MLDSNLTLGITRGLPARPCGLHRFEPVPETQSPALRAMQLPDKELRYLRTVHVVTNLLLKIGQSFLLALHVAMQVGLYHRCFAKYSVLSTQYLNQRSAYSL